MGKAMISWVSSEILHFMFHQFPHSRSILFGGGWKFPLANDACISVWFLRSANNPGKMCDFEPVHEKRSSQFVSSVLLLSTMIFNPFN